MKHNFWGFALFFILLSIPSCGTQQEEQDPKPKSPNFLLVVVDDMGFSDIGAFGSEIVTPTLDALAMEGVRFSSFMASPMCSPTRAMLLTGTDNHVVGLGTMAELVTENQRGVPGYEGYLNDRVMTIASRLRDAGYRTYMSGKWHLGRTRELSPAVRGFDKSFVLLPGAAHHFDGAPPLPGMSTTIFREDGELASWPAGAYSTDFYTDKILEYIGANIESDQPFFAYLAYTAPHWPLQAPAQLMEKYRGRYDSGWDALSQERFARLARLGFVDEEGQELGPTPPGYRPWNELTIDEQRIEARKMEVYAAMIESIDLNVKRVLDYLDKTGQKENTVIIFLSDNGPEGTPLDHTELFADHVATFDNSLENIGHPGSYAFYGPSWAWAGTAARRLYKGHQAEGGTQVPAFIWSGNTKASGSIYGEHLSVMDIAPTFLDLAQIDVSDIADAQDQKSIMRGKSFAPVLKDVSQSVHAADAIFAAELFGRRAVRQGDWKILWEEEPFGAGRWELYNIKSDPAEATDLSGTYPEKVDALVTEWHKYAEDVGVVLPEGKLPY